MPGIRSFVNSNISRPCSTRGCTGLRATASLHCGKHDQRIRQYGDEAGGRLYKKQLQKYARLAHLHLKLWQNQEPLIDALLELRDLLAPGGEPQKYLKKYGPSAKKGLRSDNPRWYLWRHLTALHDTERVPNRHEMSGPAAKGKTLPRHRPAPAAPTEAMEAILTIWLADEIGHIFRNDDSVTVALGRSVLSLRAQPVTRSSVNKIRGTWSPKARRRPLSAAAMRLMGQMIHDRLGVALWQATERIRQDDARRAAQREKARKPYPKNSVRGSLSPAKPQPQPKPAAVPPQAADAAPTPLSEENTPPAPVVAAPVEIVSPTPAGNPTPTPFAQYLARNRSTK